MKIAEIPGPALLKPPLVLGAAIRIAAGAPDAETLPDATLQQMSGLSYHLWKVQRAEVLALAWKLCAAARAAA